jgi:HlyD family type I secretion membrane fusion protein
MKFVKELVLKLKTSSQNIKQFFSVWRIKKTDNSLLPEIRMPVLFGTIIISIFAVIILFWGFFAPLDSAAIAPGTVMVIGKRRTIQHLEGGIIKKILVKEGDFVEVGDLLISLDDAKVKPEISALQKKLLTLQAKNSRLVSERDQLSTITFKLDHSPIVNQKDIEEILNGERRQFRVRKNIIENQINIFAKKISQLKNEIEAIQSQRDAIKKQQLLIKKELQSQERLFEQGFSPEQTIIDLKKKEAELQGKLGSFQASIAKTNQTILETELDINQYKTSKLDEIVSELQDIQVSIIETKEKLKPMMDIGARINIRAPESGIVTNLKYHTIGGVISPGDTIMDIVPQNEELIIEARLSPKDIDVVHQGLKAKVNLSAFKAKKAPVLIGEVMHISPDHFIDQMTGMTYFVVKVRIKEKELQNASDFQLYPGMTAELYIVTGTRTMFEYFMGPISDSLRKTFKED